MGLLFACFPRESSTHHRINVVGRCSQSLRCPNACDGATQGSVELIRDSNLPLRGGACPNGYRSCNSVAGVEPDSTCVQLGGGAVFPNAPDAWSVGWCRAKTNGNQNVGHLDAHVKTSGVPSRWQMHCAALKQ